MFLVCAPLLVPAAGRWAHDSGQRAELAQRQQVPAVLCATASALVYVAVTAVIMGLVPHHALAGDTAPFVTAFGTIFTHGAWAGKLVAALAVVSGIGALNGWTLVTTEVSRAAAQDGLFPRAFAWTDRKDTAWFGIVLAALLPSALMLWSYTTATGLTVFTNLVALTVVTVAIPYLFSACAQLTYLVSRRRRVQGWALARDATIAGIGVLFSLWVAFAAGYRPSTWRCLVPGRPGAYPAVARCGVGRL